MASWWMPVPQLRIMRRMASGDALLHDTHRDLYCWASNKRERATASARALLNKHYITHRAEFTNRSGFVTMEITPTGKQELHGNRGRSTEK